QLLLLLLSAANVNVLTNPTFTDSIAGWTSTAPGVPMAEGQEDGKSVAHITVPAGAEVGYPALIQVIDAQPGDLLEARGEAKGVGISGGAGAYMSIDFFNADGNRITFSQSGPARPQGQWKDISVDTIVPPGAVRTRLCLLLNGRGDAYFANMSLLRTPGVYGAPPEGPVTLTVTDRVACASLMGFGAEDDGWFYNEENKARGVTDEDIALREERIAWMDPDWIRMFFWYKDWNPSGDWETFEFDSPNMQSHYRTLDLYQKLGARVNVVGVEWGVKDPYGDPVKAGRAIGALLEHLVKVKGYTCVRDWTLTNEPNGYFVATGYDFRRFREMHEQVKSEIARRGLPVGIVGSDDTNGGVNWFEQCVTDPVYFGFTDYYASHRYFQVSERPLTYRFYDEHLGPLEKADPKKQLVVAEFGFQDGRTEGAMINPVMGEYPYAVWVAAFVIQGLNRGVSGYSIWCMHQMYYPGGGFMTYGLWEYKDSNWKPRPVYYAWNPLTRFTEPGDQVRVCESTHPNYVSASVAGKTLFWVNQGDSEAEVHLAGFEAKQVRVMTEATLSGDRDCGTLVPLEGGTFKAPAMSFGYAREGE
ncbi:MAG: hypothetical protein WC655_22795, partial [Candidatus Hydrogenedentales bacterium]